MLPWEPLDTEAAQPWECLPLSENHRDKRCRSELCQNRRKLQLSNSSDICTQDSPSRASDTSEPEIFYGWKNEF